MSIFDICVLVIVAVFALLGYRKGLVLSIYGFASWIFSLILAKIGSPIVAAWFQKQELYKTLAESVKNRITKLGTGSIDSISKYLTDATVGKENSFMGNIMTDSIKSGLTVNTANLVDFASNAITNIIVNVGSMIVVFIAVFILFKILKLALKSVLALPVLKQIDKSGGILFGLLEGAFISYLIIMLLYFFNFGGLKAEFDKTLIVKAFINL